MTIGIINYGLGNLGSVTRALNHIGEQSQIITSIDEADICSHIILPGVGGFSEAMNLIKQIFILFIAMSLMLKMMIMLFQQPATAPLLLAPFKKATVLAYNFTRKKAQKAG